MIFGSISTQFNTLTKPEPSTTAVSATYPAAHRSRRLLDHPPRSRKPTSENPEGRFTPGTESLHAGASRRPTEKSYSSQVSRASVLPARSSIERASPRSSDRVSRPMKSSLGPAERRRFTFSCRGGFRAANRAVRRASFRVSPILTAVPPVTHRFRRSRRLGSRL